MTYSGTLTEDQIHRVAAIAHAKIETVLRYSRGAPMRARDRRRLDDACLVAGLEPVERTHGESGIEIGGPSAADEGRPLIRCGRAVRPLVLPAADRPTGAALEHEHEPMSSLLSRRPRLPFDAP